MPPSHITERTYYDDQERTEFTATVTEIRELQRVDGKPLFQIALDRSAFYPTSGGQPHDTGVLVATARSGAVLEASVTDVVEDEAGEVWLTTAKPLQPGTKITARIDRERRRDHMQQHTGQHLLSAIAARELGAMTVGFHLGEAMSTVDLTVASLDAAQVNHLQQLVNQAVMQALPVSQRTISRGEAEALLAEGLLRKLPPREGDLRVVSIGAEREVDQNACGGTHVSTTAAIGPVLLRRVEKVRGNTRVHFLCGDRALRATIADWAMLTEIAAGLSTAPTQLPERIAKMQEEVKAARKLAKQQARSAPACAAGGPVDSTNHSG